MGWGKGLKICGANMKRIILVIVAVMTACVIFLGCGTATAKTADPKGISLHETPQIYVLQGGNSFDTMPTVTLYENGNAWLSQPPISSYGIFEIGKYAVEGDKLTVTHNDSSSATFEISDNGDTLTLLSAKLNFTSAGAVYKYRSNAEYLSGLTSIPKCETRKWIDYFNTADEIPRDGSKELTFAG